jgi:glycosyltransferase involved in cell wall biosynthesis
MKILIVIYSLRHGGAERQAVMDANSLADFGYRVTLAYHKTGALVNLVSEKVKHYKIKYSNIALASLQLFFYLLFNRYDIIHAHMFWAEKISALTGKITGHRVIFNEHGLGLWRKWFHILIMQFISIFADKIVTSCDTNRTIRITREKLNSKKVITIYNSYNMGDDNELPEINLNVLRKSKQFTIGFVGRFHEVKRLHVFLDLAERLKNMIPELQMMLIGDGVEMETLKQEMTQRNLEKYFNLPGFVLNTEKYYRRFNIFILPSKVEGFSVALLEAGAFMVPAIAFDIGGNTEIIQDGITGYTIPDNDMNSLIKKAVYLYKHKKKRIEMGMAARKRVENRFSIAKRLDRLVEIYENL